jgi:cobalt-zinc-cadmium efflux system outer membrane protein
MTPRVTLVALVSSLALGSATSAQSRPPDQSAGLVSKYVDPVSGLNLEQAIARAIDQEPNLRAARTELDVARGIRLQADLRPNPMFSFAQQEEPSGPDRQTRVEVSWPLDLFRKDGRVGVAEREIDAVRFGVLDRERLLAADVRNTYGDVASAIRELTVLDDLFAAASRQHGLVAARVEQGAAPPLERDMLRVELQRLESERWRQSGAVERALLDLKRTLGMAPEAPLKIRDDLEQLVRQEASGVLPAGAAPSQPRPDVEAAHARLRVADAQIDRAQREGRFDVNLFGMYMRMNAGFPLQGFGTSGLEPIRGVFHYIAAGAAITVPLRDGNQGAVAAAQAQRAGASAQLEAAQLAAQAEVAAARVRDEHARQALSVFTSDTRALARQNLTVVAQTYELGRATVSDVLAEERRYLDVERAFTAALREAYEARQALKRALGDVR